MATVKAKVSKSLQETVSSHPEIEQVHFDAEGGHYFNVHKFVAKEETGTKNAKQFEDGLYGRIHRQNVVDNNGRKFTISAPIVKTKIVESVSREDIFNAAPESDLVVNGLNMDNLTPKQQADIRKILAKK